MILDDILLRDPRRSRELESGDEPIADLERAARRPAAGAERSRPGPAPRPGAIARHRRVQARARRRPAAIRRRGRARRPPLARYARGGAAALSVLTDVTFFGGALDDLRAARASPRLPFAAQGLHRRRVADLLEARAAGADARPADRRRPRRRLAAGRCSRPRAAAGMDVLVEAHDEAEVRRARRRRRGDHRHQPPRPADLHRRSRAGGRACGRACRPTRLVGRERHPRRARRRPGCAPPVSTPSSLARR